MITAYFAFVVVCAAVAVSNWRAGLFACVLVDVLRDPVRKLDSEHSVLITVAALLVWCGVFWGMYQHRTGHPFELFAWYPGLRRAFALLLVALLPAAVLSCIYYPKGWLLAAMGGASYVVPFFGLSAGFLFFTSEYRLYQLMAFYCLVNSIALLGTPAEYYSWDSPVLGGIDMVWVRYQDDYVVKLISGVYRSPDIMGLHAAHVAMFGTILSLRTRRFRWVWIGIVAWAVVCILLCGRRKMIAIPLAFMASYLILGLILGIRRSTLLTRAAFVVCFSGAVALFVVREREISNEYLQYASTLFTQGAKRTNDLVVNSVLATLKQSGVLGSGLGSATQGHRYVQAGSLRGSWQEDGASRLVKELGVHGATLIVISVGILASVFWRSLKLVPASSPLPDLQVLMLSVGLANAGSFLASHQQYSGDPFSSLFVAICFGVVLGIPRAWKITALGQSRARKTSRPLNSNR